MGDVIGAGVCLAFCVLLTVWGVFDFRRESEEEQ